MNNKFKYTVYSLFLLNIILFIFCFDIILTFANDEEFKQLHFDKWDLIFNKERFAFVSSSMKKECNIHIQNKFQNLKGNDIDVDSVIFLSINGVPSGLKIDQRKTTCKISGIASNLYTLEATYSKENDCFAITFGSFAMLANNATIIYFYFPEMQRTYGFYMDGFHTAYRTACNFIKMINKQNFDFYYKEYKSIDDVQYQEQAKNIDAILIIFFACIFIIIVISYHMSLKEEKKSDKSKTTKTDNVKNNDFTFTNFNNNKNYVYIECPRCNYKLEYCFVQGNFIKCINCGLDFNAWKEYIKTKEKPSRSYKENIGEKHKNDDNHTKDEHHSTQKTEEQWKAEETKWRAEAEKARRKADEAKCRAEEEKRKREQEEARRRAEQERQRKEQEEAKRRAEQERIRRDQEEARRRAEQERQRWEQDTSSGTKGQMGIREAFDIFELPYDATFEDVKEQRIFLLKFFHPDHHYEDKKTERFATEKARKVNEAYEVLKMFFEFKNNKL